jgi:hypothetical protein
VAGEWQASRGARTLRSRAAVGTSRLDIWRWPARNVRQRWLAATSVLPPVFARIAVIAAAMRRSGQAHGPLTFEESFCEMATAFGRDI